MIQIYLFKQNKLSYLKLEVELMLFEFVMFCKKNIKITDAISVMFVNNLAVGTKHV